MGKRKEPHQALTSESHAHLEKTLANWVVNPLAEDIAFDFEVRPTGEFVDRHEVIPTPFYVQVKASRRFDDPDRVWWDFETEFLLEDCLQASVPVLLCIYEQRREECYWCIAQAYCWDVLDEIRPDWREQTTVRVSIDREPLDSMIARTRLKQAIDRVHRRISIRESVGSAQRGSFDPTPGTTLASTADLREYKHDSLEQALTHIEAGRDDLALQTLMEVYQYPEDDELTLEAIRHLLALREMDDAVTAATMIRLATHGRLLADNYDRAEHDAEFVAAIETAWTYLKEYFVGSWYRETEMGGDILVLALRELDSPHEGATVCALVQWTGDLDRVPVAELAGGDNYERQHTGENRNPREAACAERDHDFDETALREAPALARCHSCGLSRQTVQQWLHQAVPNSCDACGAIRYDIVYRRDRGRCGECR
ncbi:MAG: DUF4365 domain-containing protein [Natrialbaceae archaeon]|nr:DUF4365 domain-containing protein [Natrialbaceae archaeon]